MKTLRATYPMMAALLAALAGGLVAIWLDSVEREKLTNLQRLGVTEQVAAVRARLEGAINGTFLGLHGLAAIVSVKPDISEREFADIARGLMANDRRIRNVGFIRGSVITFLYPREGNEAALGVDLKSIPEQWPAARRAIVTRSTVLAGPVKLVQGGTALIGRIPIFVASPTGAGPDEYFGMVSMPILVDVIYRHGGLDDLQRSLRVTLTGRDGLGAGGEVFFGDAEALQHDPVTAEVLLPGGSWQIAAVPLAGWGAPAGALTGVRLLGVIVCAVLGLLGYGIVRHLQRRREHAAALQLRERRFRDFAETSADWFWETDKDYRFTMHTGDAVRAALHGKSFIGMSGWELPWAVHGEPTWESHRADLLAHRPYRNFEYGYRAADGRRRYVSVNGKPLFEEDGAFLGYRGSSRDITERVEALQRLERTEKLLLRTQQIARVGFWTWKMSADGATGLPEKNELSEQAAAIFGRTPEEMAVDDATFVGRFVHPEDRRRVEAVFRDFSAGRIKTYELEYRILRSDGAVRVVWESAELFRQEGKEAVYLGAMQDITELRRAEQKLYESEERFRQIMENIDHVFWMSDPTTQETLYVSPAYERLWGRTPESLYQDPWSFLEAIHPEDRDWVKAEISQNAHRDYDNVYRLARPDGSIRWVRDRGFPVRDREGRIYRIAGFAEDITDQIEAEEARAESERRLATLLDNLPGGAYRVRNDETWTGEYRSAGYWKLTGYSPADLANSPRHGGFGELVVHPDDLGRLRADIAAAIEELRPFEFEYRIITKSGELRWLWERGRCVSAPGEKPEMLEGIVADITEHRQLQERLRQSQKMEAVGQLTGGVAHDFNNLLAVILGNLDLAEERARDEQLKALIGTAIKAADRGSRLTRQLLAFGRRQMLQPEVTDLSALLRGLETLLSRTLGETIAIDTRLADGLCPTLVDRGQLENAILNLALNARDAMPEGGRLTIETANVDLDEDYTVAEADPVEPGRYVMIAVSDNGCGMAPEVAERAFEPFFTTKEVGKGTGLGLAMVYGFVKQSGGHVRIYSEPGRGTTVRLYLPEGDSDQPGADAPAEPAEFAAPARQGKCVLVVEDDDDVRRLVTRQLSKLGYEVREAAEGAAAIALLENDGRIDCLLTDVILPGQLLGPALAERALALRPGLAIAFMSGYPEGALTRNNTLPPDVVLLSKPFRIGALGKQLSKAFERVGAKQ
ncbi:MAG: PAS domain-containing protein [Kiloniellales bacterium]